MRPRRHGALLSGPSTSPLDTPMISSTIPIVAGSIFLIGAGWGIIKGALPLKAGGRVSRREDPLGFWVGVVGLAGIGVLLVLAGAR